VFRWKSRLGQAAEELGGSCGNEGKHFSRAKDHLYFQQFAACLKLCPVTKPWKIPASVCFSAASGAHSGVCWAPFLSWLSDRREVHHIHRGECSGKLLGSKSLVCDSHRTLPRMRPSHSVEVLQRQQGSSEVGKGHDHDRRRDHDRSTGPAEAFDTAGSCGVRGVRESATRLVLLAG